MVLVLFTLITTALAANDPIDSDVITELVVGACRMGSHRIFKEI